LIEIVETAPNQYHAFPATKVYGVESFEEENAIWLKGLSVKVSALNHVGSVIELKAKSKRDKKDNEQTW